MNNLGRLRMASFIMVSVAGPDEGDRFIDRGAVLHGANAHVYGERTVDFRARGHDHYGAYFFAEGADLHGLLAARPAERLGLAGEAEGEMLSGVALVQHAKQELIAHFITGDHIG